MAAKRLSSAVWNGGCVFSLESSGVLQENLARVVLPIPFAEGSGKASGQINFDDTAARQERDPDGGPCG